MQYRAALKTARMQAVADDIDGGGAAGSLEVGTAGMALVLITYPLEFPCGSVAGATLTFDGIPKAEFAAADGVPAAARIKNSAGTVIVDALTVGVAGADILIDEASVSAGQTCNLVAAAITHA